MLSCYLDNIISIHALLAESDFLCLRLMFWPFLFLSTLSLRRATALVWCSCGGAFDFYPRSPCGERRIKMELNRTASNFYPRSPCGERPPRGGFCYLDNIISIHALLAESDLNSSYGALDGASISIHALLAESDRKVFSIFLPIRISIHALLAESDTVR